MQDSSRWSAICMVFLPGNTFRVIAIKLAYMPQADEEDIM
jgi:hypothetical protein